MWKMASKKDILFALLIFYQFLLVSICINNGTMNRYKSPIILVPDFMKNKLYVTSSKVVFETGCPDMNNRFLLWYNNHYLNNYNCIDHIIRLIYNKRIMFFTYYEAAKFDVGDFGRISSVIHPMARPESWMKEYFGGLVKFLESIGYKRDFNLTAAPYDFRNIAIEKDFLHYAKNVTTLVESLYNLQNESVILISHGFGGALIRRYLTTKSSSWKNKYIRKWISLNGIFAGSINTVLSSILGYNRLYEKSKFQKYDLKFLLSVMPTTRYLYPSQSYFDPNQILVQYDGKTVTVRNASTVFFNEADPDYKSGFYEQIPDIWINGRIGVPFTCVYSIGIPTLNHIIISDKEKFIYSHSDKEIISIFNETGNGVVTKKELQACLSLVQQNDDHTNSVLTLNNYTHDGILSSRKLYNRLKYELIDLL